jgi:drug/metabolite transporter (DMT)-like permease
MPAAVIVLGLLSAVSWGLADFGAGVASRRVPVAAVLITTQLAGAAMSLAIALALGEGWPSGADVGWSLGSSVFGGVGLACLYIGLARGRMGVVAPVTGVLVATIPAIAGIALDGLPPTGVVVGIALAISSVLVVSRVGGGDDGRPSGLAWGLAAGLTLGVVTITLSQMTPGLVFGPLPIMRLGEAALVAAALVAATILARDRGMAGETVWRLPRGLWPMLVGIGAFDMLGTGFYIAATQSGPLAIAGVLSALYPVTTVVLAVTILRERLARWHLLGIAIALTAIVLITTGSSG